MHEEGFQRTCASLYVLSVSPISIYIYCNPECDPIQCQGSIEWAQLSLLASFSVLLSFVWILFFAWLFCSILLLSSRFAHGVPSVEHTQNWNSPNYHIYLYLWWKRIEETICLGQKLELWSETVCVCVCVCVFIFVCIQQSILSMIWTVHSCFPIHTPNSA